jgi:hypothetical protein
LFSFFCYCCCCCCCCSTRHTHTHLWIDRISEEANELGEGHKKETWRWVEEKSKEEKEERKEERRKGKALLCPLFVRPKECERGHKKKQARTCGE